MTRKILASIAALIVAIIKLPFSLCWDVALLLCTSHVRQWPTVVYGMVVGFVCFGLDCIGIKGPAAWCDRRIRADDDIAWKRTLGRFGRQCSEKPGTN